MTNSYLPSENEIRQATTRIRSTWDNEQRDIRHRLSDLRQRELAQRIFRERQGERRRRAAC
ncbi:MAG TPA: hypothetical protein VGN57_15905 [Pirellulaceae bacterium]|jgi:hypothetical protein|nr:hypothetical protein [Pirellulaceae bacterium]